MRAPEKKKARQVTPTLSARLADRIRLEAHASGRIIACRDGPLVDLGAFSAAAADRAQNLSIGLPLAALASGRHIDKEIDLLVRRLAGHGLLEYRLRSPNGDEVILEPQVADYWPRTPQLGDADVLVLSRFAYMRRRGNDMVLESPRAGALFRICNPKIAAALATLSAPRQVRQLRRQDDFPGIEILGLLVDCQILFKTDAAGGRARPRVDTARAVGFHDLLFHTRSTQGRHSNPLGGLYPHAGVIPPLPPCGRAGRKRKSIWASARPT